MYRSSLVVCCFVVLECLTGCTKSGGDIVDTVAVAGVVSYQGKPLEYYQVTLFPENGQRPAVGTSNDRGEFVLGTNTTDDGAIVGMHRVAVNYVGPPNNDPEFGMNDFSAPPPPKVKLPAKYNDPALSGLTIDVPKSGLQQWELKL